MLYFRAASRPRILFAALALSLLLSCQNQMGVQEPHSEPTAFPQVASTPPPIPDFPSQGPLPTAQPAQNGAFADGDAALAEMAAAPAAAGGSAKASAGASDSARPGESSVIAPLPPERPDQPPAQAGLLTAGEWDDLQNWSFWLNLLDDSKWAKMPEIWQMDTRKRIPVVVTGPQGRLADAPLELLDAQGQVLFQARTNANGEAQLFADLLPQNQGSAQRLQLRLSLGEESQSQEVQLPVSAQEPILFESQQDLSPAVYADLMLSVDTTGSMGDELEYLKAELKNVASRISAQNTQELKLRLSANFYRDTSDAYVVRSFPFTENSDTLVEQLSQQSAQGGGDFPEAVDVALVDAVDEHQWSPTARARLLFLVLDAPPHQDDQSLKRLHTSLERAAAKGIRIIPVASSGIDKETEFLLRMMAQATGGRYVFLTDDSGIGNPHLKPTVGQYTVEKLNDLMVRVATEYITGTVNTAATNADE